MRNLKTEQLSIVAALALGSQGFLAAAEKPPEMVSAHSTSRDYGLMWWPDGWSSLDWSSADRTPQKMIRCLQTGYYAMAMDTGSMRIVNLGPIKEARSYADAASSNDEAVFALPPAELKLAITAHGKRYHCIRGAHPRLVNTGRFVQRGDIVGLVFTSEDGERLATRARMEVTAWPETLSLELEAGPNGTKIRRFWDEIIVRSVYGCDTFWRWPIALPSCLVSVLFFLVGAAISL